jgi:hypothetical protein
MKSGRYRLQNLLSYLKSSPIFFYASFWLFILFGSFFRSFLIYVLIVVKALSESPRHKDDNDRLHGAIFIEVE